MFVKKLWHYLLHQGDQVYMFDSSSLYLESEQQDAKILIKAS